MVSSKFKSFNGHNPYEGFNEYCRVSSRMDKLVSQYKKAHNVTRLTKKTMDKLFKLACPSGQ